MKIAIGGDHAGYELKTALIPLIENLGHEVVDYGTNSLAPVDYPDFSRAVGEAVRDGVVDRGIVVCGSGIGANIAANKIHGVRAGQSNEHYSAHQGVEHDDMNVLVLAARIIGPAVADEIVTAFLGAQFSGAERHVRRLKKVAAIEAEN